MAVRDLSSWTSRVRYRVVRAIVNGRGRIFVLRDVNLCGNSTYIARRISHRESDGVDPAVATSDALGTQLHRLAIAGDHNIPERVSRARCVFGFVTGDLL